jgi:hypothetical protein
MRNKKLIAASLLTAVSGAVLMGAPAKADEKTWSCKDFKLSTPNPRVPVDESCRDKEPGPYSN